MKNNEYYKAYENALIADLLNRSNIYKAGEVPSVIELDELNEYWNKIAPEYMADAVKNINDYPKFTLAVPAYFGTIMAIFWDERRENFLNYSYNFLCGDKNFDTADEYISQHFLNIKPQSDEYLAMADRFCTMAQVVMDHIRHEEIQPGTTEAFYILAYGAKAVFKAAVAIELFNRGYRYKKQNFTTEC